MKNPQAVLKISGARQNNLKNIFLEIPKKKLVVFTGVSGSGKSSLVFDTIYAEGHRKYVESLSSYARQFLARIQKPNVDYIHGLSPAIAIEQRTSSSNPRSTVGTVTEVYDYLRILFARIGKTFSPISGEEVKRDSVTDIVDFIFQQKPETKIYVLSSFHLNPEIKRDFKKELELTLQKGFSRIWSNGEIFNIEDIDPKVQKKLGFTNTKILIDRFVLEENMDEDFRYRIADSVQIAITEGLGDCFILVNDKMHHFSDRFEKDGMQFETPTPHFFHFNSPIGACPDCQGSGESNGLVVNKVIPNPNLTLEEGMVKLWTGKFESYASQFIKQVKKYHSYFEPEKPYRLYSKMEKELLWKGGDHVEGIERVYELMLYKSYESRAFALNFYGKIPCPSCQGTRIRKEAGYVKIHGYSIQQLLNLPIDELKDVFDRIPFTEFEKKAAQRLILEIKTRLSYLVDVGLGYLTLNRKSVTLSGGEMQRIKLSTSLGSNLTGSLYILDEPSIGLHPRDSERLMRVLQKLRDLGNSVYVIEHDETIMNAADWLVDVGPGAGEYGGEIVFSGLPGELIHQDKSLTAKYLTEKEEIPIPLRRRTSNQFITIAGITIHNIINETLKIPFHVMTVICGVSGSGKTTIIKEVFYPLLMKSLGFHNQTQAVTNIVTIDNVKIQGVEFVSQQALSVSSRSNPATYLGVFDLIREIFAKKSDLKHDLTPQHFSFNVDGGRCDNCQGEGKITVEMQFLPNVEMICEVCHGKRYKEYVLEVTYHGKNIYDVLQMTVSEAITFFAKFPRITEKLQSLVAVGLEYLRLGQSTNTLSGGEAQRLKLASSLSANVSHTIFIFDEPTTGLHFSDIKKLLCAFDKLIENQNTVVVIEHQLDVIKYADHLIELGPEGGEKGGKIVFQGTPEELIQQKDKETETAKYLKAKLKK